MTSNENHVSTATNHVVPVIPIFVPIPVTHEENLKNSMETISRDGDRKCCSISLS